MYSTIDQNREMSGVLPPKPKRTRKPRIPKPEISATSTGHVPAPDSKQLPPQAPDAKQPEAKQPPKPRKKKQPEPVEPQHTAWCMRCKKHGAVKDHSIAHSTDGKRRMLKGSCCTCSGKINKFMKKEEIAAAK